MGKTGDKRIELLSPAGNMEKFETALAYGADAVYIGGKNFSMRAAAENFKRDEMKKAVDMAHLAGRKVFVTLNILPRDEDMGEILDEFAFINEIKADAVIISDPGLISHAKKIAPSTAVHISTQANVLNSETAKLFAGIGADRIILARELGLKEIRRMRQELPRNVEIEVFVHGAMCISYSGRCLLSNYMTSRDANRGECAQSCRWKYFVSEEKRPGEYFPVVEDDRGTFIFNSKDLCLIEHIPQLIEAGVDSLKIEGRMKGVFYTALTTRSYRRAIDSYFENPEGYDLDRTLLEDLQKISHRKYTTGFFKDGEKSGQIYESSSYIRTHSFVGKVLGYDVGTGLAKIMQRNPLFEKEEIEFVQPHMDDFRQKAVGMVDTEGEKIVSTPHAQMVYYMMTEKPVEAGAIMVKKKSEV